MAELIVLSSKAVEAVNALQERVSSKQWSEFSRTSFVYNATQTINALEDLMTAFEEMQSTLAENGSQNNEEVQKHSKEMQSLIELLSKNKELEFGKINRAREKGIEMLAQDTVVPENYSALEQKVLSIVIKSRFLLERIAIQARKEQSRPFFGTKATKDVLDLLDEKEKELQKLKEDHHRLKHRGLLAGIEETTTADIEHQLNEITRNMHANSQLLFNSFELHQQKLFELNSSQKEIREKVRLFEHAQHEHFQKSLELVTALKKERDYAKKLLLDIEGETIALRNMYSQKILGLEQEIAHAKSQAFEEFRQKLAVQEKEIMAKAKQAGQLKKELKEKEDETKELKKQLKGKEHKK